MTENIGWVKGYTVNEGEEDEYEYARYGGGVVAGRYLDGDVTAANGGIAEILAGTEFIDHGTYGRITGNITAGKYDLLVTSIGKVTGDVEAGWGVDLTAAGEVTGDVTAHEGRADVLASAWVDSTIFGLLGVRVEAGQGVAGSVVAGDDTHRSNAEVLAVGTVSASVTAFRAATVVADGAVSGAVWGRAEVVVSAGEDVSGGVTSLGSTVTLTALGAVSGAVSALFGVTIRAGGSVTGSVTAGNPDDTDQGEIEIASSGDVTGTVSAASGVLVEAAGGVSGAVSTFSSSAVVTALGAVTGEYARVYGSTVGGPVTAENGVEARALADITGALTALGGQVLAWAGLNVTAPVTAGLDVYIEASGSVLADVRAGVADAYANALVRATGDVAGNVSATASAEVWAGGHILGDVIAGEGEAVAITIGSVRGVVRSGLNQVRVWAPGGTGRSSSGYPYDDPAMDWVMVLTNGEPGEHIGSVIGRTAAGGTELISATFADPPAQPPTPADPDRVKKAADDLKQKPRGMAPPTDLMGKFRDDWTKEEYLRRAEEVTQWWKNLSAADADDLQDWWQTATDAERKDLLKDLLNSDSPTQRDFYKRIGEPVNPPPQSPAQPPPGPPAKEGPTDEQLKDWAKKAEEYLKGSAAQADEKIRADDDEKDCRARGIRWRDHAATRMEVRLGKDKDDPEVVKLRGESKQLQDRVNFGVDKGATLDPVPLNDAAKAQVAALRQEVAELRTIKDMGMADKLKAVFERAINAKGPDGKPKLEQAIIDGLKEAIQPQNLATMAAVMGVIGAQHLHAGRADRHERGDGVRLHHDRQGGPRRRRGPLHVLRRRRPGPPAAGLRQGGRPPDRGVQETGRGGGRRGGRVRGGEGRQGCRQPEEGGRRWRGTGQEHGQPTGRRQDAGQRWSAEGTPAGAAAPAPAAAPGHTARGWPSRCARRGEAALQAAATTEPLVRPCEGTLDQPVPAVRAEDRRRGHPRRGQGGTGPQAPWTRSPATC